MLKSIFLDRKHAQQGSFQWHTVPLFSLVNGSVVTAGADTPQGLQDSNGPTGTEGRQGWV